MPMACLYVGPPGSGKSFLASKECDIEADIRYAEDFKEFSNLDCYIGLTNAQCSSEANVKNFIIIAAQYNIIIDKVKAFVGSKETFLNNVKNRETKGLREVEGMINLWCRSNYDPNKWELDIRLDVLLAKDYSKIS